MDDNQQSDNVKRSAADEEASRDAGVPEDVVNSEGLHRTLSDAQIGMISIGGSIGTGLIISSGSALAHGGPAGLLIGYVIMGFCCWVVLTSLGEITAFLPLTSFTRLGGKYVDEAFGCALTWCYCLKYLIIAPSQVVASALLISFWRPDLSGAIFISIFIPVIIASNACGVRFFGKIEYAMSLGKIIILSALIAGGLAISLGWNPKRELIGFRYWSNGGALREYKETGSLGQFLGVWSTLPAAMFAYLGSELIGVCAGETNDPRRAIPKAIQLVVLRILVFYIGSIMVISLLVSSRNPMLVQTGRAKDTAAASPFVIAIKSVGIEVLPSIINAALLLFTLSASNSDLYVATRTMYGLAKEGQIPRADLFLRTNSLGVPYVCLGVCSMFLFLAYLSANAGGSVTFTYLTEAVTVFGGIAWFGILLTHINFMAGCKAQGVDRDRLPYKAPFQPAGSYIAIVIVTIVLLSKGFDVFWPTFDARSFVTNYIGIPVTFGIFLAYKWTYKTQFLHPKDMIIRSRLENEIDKKHEKTEEQPGNVEDRPSNVDATPTAATI